MSDLTAPLQSVIQRLAATPVKGLASELRARFTDASSEIVVLADCSGSMEDYIGSTDRRKCDELQIALDDVLRTWPGVKVVAFNSSARVVTGRLPEPAGGTNLAAALDLAAQWRPRRTIVISDGEPDHEEAALAAAQRMTGAIDTIFCGHDGSDGCAFLRQLSRLSAGVSIVWDGERTALGSSVRGLLAAGG